MDGGRMNQAVARSGAQRFGDEAARFAARMARGRDGLAVAGIVAIGATFLSTRLGPSPMLFALLLGMALNFLRDHERCRPGIDLASTLVLRTGVALLGLRITVGEIAALGWSTAAIAVAGIALTIGVGLVAARALHLGERFGVLTGGAVSICGASAALAISSVLPRNEHSERDASFVVISVTALSTIAMIAYPILARMLSLDDRMAGVFLGGTIHDVAQVVGAGYSVSQSAGDTATIVKLLRVAMLLPVCLAIGMVLRSRGGRGTASVPVLPRFAVAFGILVLAGSVGWVSPPLAEAGGSVSAWLLATAMAAIGMKTSLSALARVGARAIALVVGETLFLGVLVLLLLAHLGSR
jgi:uncharacterized integral membrane protein (TIGR00698 family)